MSDAIAAASGRKIHVLTVWERVMKSDNEAPSAETLARVTHGSSRQFWDPDRVISKAWGEKDEKSIVWDCVYVYAPETRWEEGAAMPPAHLYTGRPVVDRRDEFAAALR